jgi:hypothetical protein
METTRKMSTLINVSFFTLLLGTFTGSLLLSATREILATLAR